MHNMTKMRFSFGESYASIRTTYNQVSCYQGGYFIRSRCYYYYAGNFIRSRCDYNGMRSRYKVEMGNFMRSRSYSDMMKRDFTVKNSSYWKRLKTHIEGVRWKERFQGSIYAYINFSVPYPRVIELEMITLAFIILVEMYAYNVDSKYVKFTIGYTMNTPSYCDVTLTLGKSIPLYDTLGNKISKKLVYDQIETLVRLNGEKYSDCEVKGVFINIYYEYKETLKPVNFPQIASDNIIGIINNVVHNAEIVDGHLPNAKSLLYKKSRIKTNISAVKGKKIRVCSSFIVADLETVLEDDVQIPYAAGFLVVNPGDDLTNLPDYSIQTFFSEDHKQVLHTIKDRSSKMLLEFYTKLEDCVKKNHGLKTIYFHNLGRFDGIFIIRYFVDRGHKYTIKPLVRNNRIYEIKIYQGSRLLFCFKDSLVLLPGSLQQLGKTLCPELGPKGSIPHDLVSSDNLLFYSVDLIKYLRQDVLLLGGVMQKAQKIYSEQYNIDIEGLLTLAGLSLKIFRQNFYDDKAFPISIPTKNQDTFIRRAYYGGHVDVYKPHGENLYYYDVNSLYPFIMKNYPMPCGIPVWKNNLENVELDSLFGFIEAYVI